jgi:hypothetical protein
MADDRKKQEDFDHQKEYPSSCMNIKKSNTPRQANASHLAKVINLSTYAKKVSTTVQIQYPLIINLQTRKVVSRVLGNVHTSTEVAESRATAQVIMLNSKRTKGAKAFVLNCSNTIDKGEIPGTQAPNLYNNN